MEIPENSGAIPINGIQHEATPASAHQNPHRMGSNVHHNSNMALGATVGTSTSHEEINSAYQAIVSKISHERIAESDRNQVSAEASNTKEQVNDYHVSSKSTTCDHVPQVQANTALGTTLEKPSLDGFPRARLYMQASWRPPDMDSIVQSGECGQPAHAEYHEIPNVIVVKNIPFFMNKEQLLRTMEYMQLPTPDALNYHFDSGVFKGNAVARLKTPTRPPM